MSLLELLNRTRLQIFTYKQGTMMKNAYPDGMGSGFFFLHKDRVMLVTADHVCHPFDYEPGRTQRVFEDKDVALVNNWVEKDEKGNGYANPDACRSILLQWFVLRDVRVSE